MTVYRYQLGARLTVTADHEYPQSDNAARALRDHATIMMPAGYTAQLDGIEWTDETRETWAVRLHLNNDEDLQREAMQFAVAAYAEWTPHPAVDQFYSDRDEGPARQRLAATHAAAEALEQFVRDDLLPDYDGTAGSLLAGDLLTRAASRVDWPAVAADLLETYADELDDDQDDEDQEDDDR